MRLLNNFFTKTSLVFLSAFVLTTSVFAAANDYSYVYSDSTNSDSDIGLTLVLFCIGVFFGLFVLLCYAINIWMLIDVIRKSENQLPNRSVWMIVLILGLLMGWGVVPAIIYFVIARKKS